MKYSLSSIGQKQIMAVTGLVWAGFVLSHMIGNLLIIAGPDVYNGYSHALVSNPLVYLAEAGLVLTLLFHVVKGIRLTIANRRARDTKYALTPNGAKSPRFQSRWMIFHGSIILVFIILHLLSFKYGPGIREGYITTVNGVEMRDIYRLVVEAFRQPGYMLWYVIAMVFVGLHLSHGFYSSFASLGFYHPRYSPILNKFGYLYAVVVALGFIVPPIYVYFVL